MKPVFILFFIVAAWPAFAQQTIISDKNVELREVPAFSGIKISGGIDAYLSQDTGCSLAVSADEAKFRDNIVTEVKNGILVISYNNEHIRFNNGDKQLRAYISYKMLESLEASGACDLIITDSLVANSMLLKLSGACDVKGRVKITDLTLNLSGASTVKINGTVQNLNLTASGASDLKNYDLIIQNCVAKLSGASDVRVTINNSISGSASGASSLHYDGTPERKDITTSGASSISPRN